MKAAYDLTRAAFLAKASRMSYDKANIDCFGTQVLIINGHSSITVAFRGTELNSVDILTDVYAKFNDSRTHSGFATAYDVVHEEIQKVLNSFKEKDLYITGHSLGGALATIACTRLKHPKLKACYTFGSPRVGDKDMDDEIPCPVYRFVNHNDVVPRLPLLTMGYRHVGDLRYINKEGRIVRSPSSLITELKFFLSLPTLLGARHAVKDHSISEYVRKLYEEKQRKRLPEG